MKFSRYIWELFRNSADGVNDIRLFQDIDIEELSKKFRFAIDIEYVNENRKPLVFQPYSEMLNALENDCVQTICQAKHLFQKRIIKYVENDKYNCFIHCLAAYSTALFQKFPDYFFPFYFYSESYPDFISICGNFDITLPPLPPRHDWIKRTWYYYNICEILHGFRNKHDIDAKEFPAFFYSFGLKTMEKTSEEDLPKPSRVYFLGAGNGGGNEENNLDFNFLDEADKNSTTVWGAGNLNIKKGDLVLFYCVSPRKYLHSIWRALEDSYIDPFRFHYFCVKLGYPQKIIPVSFQELKRNSVFKENSTVNSHMQGMNGRPLTVQEYSELLNMIENKGQSTGSLIKLPVYNRGGTHIESERDVEMQLIEPLLKDLGFQNNDWVRQMPIRMGRQTKYFSDYAIHVNQTKGKEKAKIILEAKYSINSGKQLQEAFDQARSYGLRLQSEKIVLADRDFIWVYSKNKSDFDSIPTLKMHWNELTNSDNLYKLSKKLK
ncbi:MAG: hypothetical protein ACOCW8_00730 [bacterium]